MSRRRWVSGKELVCMRVKAQEGRGDFGWGKRERIKTHLLCDQAVRTSLSFVFRMFSKEMMYTESNSSRHLWIWIALCVWWCEWGFVCANGQVHTPPLSSPLSIISKSHSCTSSTRASLPARLFFSVRVREMILVRLLLGIIGTCLQIAQLVSSPLSAKLVFNRFDCWTLSLSLCLSHPSIHPSL